MGTSQIVRRWKWKRDSGVERSTAMPLNLWVVTHSGMEWPFHRGLIGEHRYLPYDLLQLKNCCCEVVRKIMLWLGGGSPQHEKLYQMVSALGSLRTNDLKFKTGLCVWLSGIELGVLVDGLFPNRYVSRSFNTIKYPLFYHHSCVLLHKEKCPRAGSYCPGRFNVYRTRKVSTNISGFAHSEGCSPHKHNHVSPMISLEDFKLGWLAVTPNGVISGSITAWDSGESENHLEWFQSAVKAESIDLKLLKGN